MLYMKQDVILTVIQTWLNRRMVSLVGNDPVCRVGGLGSIPGRTTTQGLKIIEEKVLDLL